MKKIILLIIILSTLKINSQSNILEINSWEIDERFGLNPEKEKYVLKKYTRWGNVVYFKKNKFFSNRSEECGSRPKTHVYGSYEILGEKLKIVVDSINYTGSRANRRMEYKKLKEITYSISKENENIILIKI